MNKNKLIMILAEMIQEISYKDIDLYEFNDGKIKFRHYQHIKPHIKELQALDITIEIA